MNLATIIDPHPADAVALISRGRATTYGELRDQVAHLRGGLLGLGLDPGDRVAILCANNWYFVVSYLATLSAGLVAVPLNPASPPPEVTAELAAIGARVVIVGPAGRKIITGVDLAAVPVLEHVVCAQGAEVADCLAFDDLLAAEPAPVVARDDDDLAVLVFTSGTAGSPKAAMLSHGNLTSNIDQVQDHVGRAQDGDDVSFGVLPLFHIFGLNVVLGVSLRAGSAVLLIERFDPTSALDAIALHKVTVVSGAPTMWMAWAAVPDADGSALGTVRLATSGAAKLPLDIGERIRSRYGVEITEGYGLTEASPVVTSAVGLAAHYGSIGVPLAGMRVRLVDADGDDVLVGDAGEIWV
ncbi:hypothetical protein BH24ACT3_BH24ACT3_16120 [soil metagenome]